MAIDGLPAAEAGAVPALAALGFLFAAVSLGGWVTPFPRCRPRGGTHAANHPPGTVAVPPNPWGHPEVPLLINCPAPCDEFVHSRFRKKGDEIKSHNYLLKLQSLSRRTELLQTPLAGSLCTGERE